MPQVNQYLQQVTVTALVAELQVLGMKSKSQSDKNESAELQSSLETMLALGVP